MTAQTATKVTVPVGTDGWNPVAHIKGAFDTARTIIPVADKTERNDLAALFPAGVIPTGTAVFVGDTRRIQIWDGGKWSGPPYGQLSALVNAGPNIVGIAMNAMLESSPYLELGRIIEVKATIDGSINLDNSYVGYSLVHGGTGITGHTVLRTSTKRYNTSGFGEGFELSARYISTVAGALRFALLAQVSVPASGAQVMTSSPGNSRLTVTDCGPA